MAASPLRTLWGLRRHRRLYKGNTYKDGFLLKGVPFKSMDMEEIAPTLNEMQVGAYTMPRCRHIRYHAMWHPPMQHRTLCGDRAAAQRCGSIHAAGVAHSPRLAGSAATLRLEVSVRDQSSVMNAAVLGTAGVCSSRVLSGTGGYAESSHRQ